MGSRPHKDEPVPQVEGDEAGWKYDCGRLKLRLYSFYLAIKFPSGYHQSMIYLLCI
jgi:hypothetical protein